MLDGFRFRIHSELVVKEDVCVAPNLLSAKLNPEAVDTKLNKELQENRIAGPFLAPPLPNFHVSPLGVVPKKFPGEFRMIHHLSYPRGLSVNDSIDPEHCSVKYSSIGDAIRCVKESGVGSFQDRHQTCIPNHPYSSLGLSFVGYAVERVFLL